MSKAKLEKKVHRIVNNLSDTESSDDESFDIRELNDRLDEEMIKQMQEDFDDDDDNEKDIINVNNNVVSSIKPRDMEFENEWKNTLITMNNNLKCVFKNDASQAHTEFYKKISVLFDIIIIKVYNYCKNQNTNFKWYEIIREFINWHDKIQDKDFNEIFNDDMDIYIKKMNLSEKDNDEIKQQCFKIFVSEKCANVNEDEIDGPYDLDTYEWDAVDDIIMCYYYYCYYHNK